MRLTQLQIGKHLGLSQQSVGKFLAKEGIDARTSTVDEIREAYIRRLRKAATDNQKALTHEKILSERVDREMKSFQLQQKKSQLINMAQFEPEMRFMVDTFRTEMLKRDDQLKAFLDAQYEIDIDISVLNKYIFDALKHFGRFNTTENTVEFA
jgi:hypothetical protein